MPGLETSGVLSWLGHTGVQKANEEPGPVATQSGHAVVIEGYLSSLAANFSRSESLTRQVQYYPRKCVQARAWLGACKCCSACLDVFKPEH